MNDIVKDSGENSPKKGSKSKGFTVGVEADAYRSVGAHSKKLNISKSEYASAAIRFFADKGLNPTADHAEPLSSINATVGKETLRIREQNVDIGNRLIIIMRRWEKEQYLFLQQQQMSLNNYLEVIESNLLQHLVNVETNLFDAMVEKLLKLEVEVSTVRGLASILFLKAVGKPELDFPALKARLDQENEEELAAAIQEFLKTNTVPKPRASAKRAVIPAPERPVAPPKPAPPAPNAPPQV